MGDLKKLKELEVLKFVRMLKADSTDNQDFSMSFFLGAGCSISSDIEGAAGLVKGWLPKLQHDVTGNSDNLDIWAKKYFSEYPHNFLYDKKNPASLYQIVIEDLFPTQALRQNEIERIVDGKLPGFGYAALAQLMAYEKCGHKFNVVLTTNFDDLVANACYLFTEKNPLVIGHHSLATFAERNNSRPLVVKLHGDAHLPQKHTENETSELPKELIAATSKLLSNSGLIFLGYGGNDESVFKLLEGLSDDDLKWGMYWVSNSEPKGRIRTCLERHNAFWIRHQDFDEFMYLIKEEFKFKDVNKNRFETAFKQYMDTYKKMSEKTRSKKDEEQKTDLDKSLIKSFDKEFEKTLKSGSEWGFINQANALQKTDPAKAERLYEAGIAKHKNSVNLLNNYANFIKDVRENYDEAEEYYKKALEIDPDDIATLNNYAIFLTDIPKGHDKAEELYKKALEIAPNNVGILNNYANFITKIRKIHDKAEQYYKKALEIDPDDINALNGYAALLTSIRKDHNKAEQYYKKAIEIDPNFVAALANYANLLKDIRKDHDKAEEYYKKTLEIDPDYIYVLSSYATLLKDVRKDYDKAEEYYKKTLEIDPDYVYALNNYAVLLTDVRKDYDKAEQHYKKALALDPDYVSALGNYSQLLLGLNRDSEGFEYLYKALEKLDTAQNQDLELECRYYLYAHVQDTTKREQSLKRIKELINSGVRSDFWDFIATITHFAPPQMD